MTRRTLIGSIGAAVSLAAQPPRPHRQVHKEWKPLLGVLGPYTPGNVEWAKAQGFNNMILGSSERSTLNALSIGDNEIADVKATLAKHQMHVSALQVGADAINPDLARRERSNQYFVKAIELAGKLGVPYIGTQSGRDPAKSFEQQIDEIVRVYHEKFFPACEQHKVRILWEPYPEAPNLATSPVGFAALFKAFGDSPYVGLQYDPSHLVRQFMDPIQTARDFVDKIYDVHLKDTEIRWDVLKRAGINPVNRAQWWLYRLPGLGSINWAEFFGVLQRAGYQGAMSIEHEDPYYGSPNRGAEFTDDFKTGFRMA